MPDEVPIKQEDFDPDHRFISNSEVQNFLSCPRMYYFTFGLNLEPIKQSDPLSRGNIGHGGFEAYINARLEGSSHELSLRAVSAFFAKTMQEHPVELVMETQFLWSRYMGYHDGWPEWNLLGTEERLDLQLTDTLGLPMRYDLYVEEKATGRRLVGDFKFTYDFWSDNDHYINPQMPKYIAIMRLNKLQVDGGFIEQIRTRKITDKSKLNDPKNLWKRNYYYPSDAKIQAVLRQHIQASMKIEQFRALGLENMRKTAIPVLNKYGPCRYCSFIDLCNSMNEGKTDLTVDIRANFKTNTYDYNKPANNIQSVKVEDL